MITNREEILQELIDLIDHEEVVLISFNDGIEKKICCKKPKEGTWFYPITETFYLTNYFDDSFLKIEFAQVLCYSVPIKDLKEEFLKEIKEKYSNSN